MKRNIKVGRYIGIDVYLHYSWFIIFVMLGWALATGFFPQNFPGHTASVYWVLGLFSSLLLFASVLLHELSHSVVARRHGIKVDRITLFFFGGMAGMHEHKMSPKAEFQMAIAGPAFSLLLSLVFLLTYNVSAYFGPLFYVAAVSSYLFRINLILAVFNLVPGFPLDGGRVFRAIAWYWTKDFKKATRMATLGGKFVAYFLIFTGLANTFMGNFGGLWMALIGFFILTLSTLSYEQVVIKDALTGIRAGDFAKKRFDSAAPETSVKKAVAEQFLAHDTNSCLVLEDGVLQGMLTLEQAKALPKNRWAKAKAKDIMIPASRIRTAGIGTPAYTALTRMMRAGLDKLPVIERKKVVGVVHRDDIIRYVRFREKKQQLEKMGFDVE